MGVCSVAIVKRAGPSPFGQSAVVDITLSSSYATGGDTVNIKDLGIGNRCSALILSGSVNGRVLEVAHGATEFTAPLIQAFQDNAVAAAAALGEVAAATNLTSITVRAIAYASPYR